MPEPWSLAYPGTAIEFGSIETGLVFNSAPEIGAPDIETDDQRVPRGDGVLLGADYRGGQTITFGIDAVGRGEAGARESVRRLARAWRADEIRRTPGAVATLTARYPGVERVMFGRPRRFAQSDGLTPYGVADIVCDFACVDDLLYSAEEQVATVGLVPPSTGGLVAPLAEPLTTTASSDRSSAITVGGDLPTRPVIEISGPITNPVVEIVGVLRMEFRVTLAYDETLVVDARPWARTITRNGAGATGALTPGSTRISHASIPPGSHELVLRGTSTTGSASLTVRTRDAYSTL